MKWYSLDDKQGNKALFSYPFFEFISKNGLQISDIKRNLQSAVRFFKILTGARVVSVRSFPDRQPNLM